MTSLFDEHLAREAARAADERVIDGILHRLEGKTYVPMSAQELTARLLEARKAAEVPYAPPLWVRPSVVPWAPPYEITCADNTRPQ